jgi:hypothetical protein
MQGCHELLLSYSRTAGIICTSFTPSTTQSVLYGFAIFFYCYVPGGGGPLGGIPNGGGGPIGGGPRGGIPPGGIRGMCGGAPPRLK